MTPEWVLGGGVLLLLLAFVVVIVGDARHWWCDVGCGSCDQRRAMREVRRNRRRRNRRVEALAHNWSTFGAWCRSPGRRSGRHTHRAPAGKRVRVVLR